MTDHSSVPDNSDATSPKNETKQALLGELESIKDLLSEEEMADIPVLRDTVSDAGIKHDDIPLLLINEETNNEEIPILHSDISPDSIATLSLNDSVSLDDSQTIDAALNTIEFNLDLNGETSIKQDDTTDPIDAPPSQEDDTLYLKDEMMDLEAEAVYLDTDMLDQNNNIPEHQQPQSESDEQATPDIYSPEFQAASEPQPSDDTPPDLQPIEAILTIEPALLAPEALPGQQRLFDRHTLTAPQPSAKTIDHAKARPSSHKPSGENPFLPKHIRDRLHTDKSLMDIIRESPLPPPEPTRELSGHVHEQSKAQLPPQLSEPHVHAIVDEVLAIYLPKIEAELRERLLAEIQGPSQKTE